MNWLIGNHPSYCNMTRPEHAPAPVVLGGFEETKNNTDESDESDIATENKIDAEQMTFAPRHEPSESTGPYQNEKEFIFYTIIYNVYFMIISQFNLLASLPKKNIITSMR